MGGTWAGHGGTWAGHGRDMAGQGRDMAGHGRHMAGHGRDMAGHGRDMAGHGGTRAGRGRDMAFALQRSEKGSSLTWATASLLKLVVFETSKALQLTTEVQTFGVCCTRQSPPRARARAPGKIWLRFSPQKLYRNAFTRSMEGL